MESKQKKIIPINTEVEVTVPDYVLTLTKDQVFDLYVGDKITEQQYLYATKIIDTNETFEVEQQKKTSEIQYKLYDNKGKPSVYFPNWCILMAHHDITFKYNQVTRKIEIFGLDTRDLNDCVTDVETICVENDFLITDNKIWSYMQRMANQNSYNPVHEHLMNCYFSWDKQSRLQQVFDSVIHQKTYSKGLKELLMKRWLISTARISGNNLDLPKPLQCEGVLVFKGKQGLGKTAWINHLIPLELKRYFSDNVKVDVNSKDSIFEATSNWIAELGEMGETLKGSADSLKMFFTNGLDRQRRPYERSYTDMPRLTSFYGTINDPEFLKDETGNRRYWIVDVEDFNTDLIKDIDVNQLWGEIMYMLLEQKEPHWLSKEEQHMLHLSNEDSRIIQPIEYKVEINFDWDKPKEDWSFVPSSEIFDRLDIKRTTKGMRTALERFGAEYDKQGNKRGYIVPPFVSVYSQGK